MQRIKIDQISGQCRKSERESLPFSNRYMITKDLLIITQHGKSVAVLLDVGEYEALQEKS